MNVLEDNFLFCQKHISKIHHVRRTIILEVMTELAKIGQTLSRPGPCLNVHEKQISYL